MARSLLILSFLLAAPALLPGARLLIDNPTGDVRIRIVYSGGFQARGESASRRVTNRDVVTTQSEGQYSIKVRPQDDIAINLDMDVPFGTLIEVQDVAGAFRFEGFPSYLAVGAREGPVEIAAPWSAVRFLLFSEEKAGKIETPAGYKFRQRKGTEFPGANWVLEDRLGDDLVTYGRIRVKAKKPERVTLIHQPIPAESPVKLHWQAKEVAEKLLSEEKLENRRTIPQTTAPAEASSLNEPEGEFTFTSDVRLVNINAAIYDAEGKPLTGLATEDFHVFEDGVEQDIDAAESEDAPFNLAILLDYSGSTSGSREKMKEIATLFVNAARPQDRVAFYLLASDRFNVVSELTTNHEQVRQMIQGFPNMSGASPIYDAIVLAYDQELAKRPNERNALLVISDGKDNRMELTGTPSKVTFRQLQDAAKRMDSLIYPIFLGPNPETQRRRSNNFEAYARFEELAQTAGGRVFAAATIEDFRKASREVSEELRSVYGISYRPKNQDFTGGFRSVEVRVDRPGARVRARDGYYAR